MPRTPHFMRRKFADIGGSGFSDASTLVNVSHEFDPDEDKQVDHLEGHLRVSTEREYQLDVPHFQTDESDKRFADMSNPHNQCGPLLREEVPVVTGSDYESFMAAFNKRCNTTHDDDIEDDEYTAAYDLTMSLPMDHCEPWEENEIDRARWMAKFDPQKRARMEQAYHEISDTSMKAIGTKDLSVKHETLIKRNDPSWAPRVIYAGSDVFNAVTGPAAMVAMERFNAAIATGPIAGIHTMTAYKQTDVALATFISGLPQNVHIVEGDYSANDKHQRYRVHLLFDAFSLRRKDAQLAAQTLQGHKHIQGSVPPLRAHSSSRQPIANGHNVHHSAQFFLQLGHVCDRHDASKSRWSCSHTGRRPRCLP